MSDKHKELDHASKGETFEERSSMVCFDVQKESKMGDEDLKLSVSNRYILPMKESMVEEVKVASENSSFS